MHFTSEDGSLLVFIGPSGTGKSTAIRALSDTGIIEVTPTWTTRPPRPGELEAGVEHHFASEEEFSVHEAAGKFHETETMFGLPYRYGMPIVQKPAAGKTAVVMMRAPLVGRLKKYYSHMTVYQIEDDIERVKERLLAREAHGEPLGTRLSDYEKEVGLGQTLATRTFTNQDMDRLVKQLAAAIKEDFRQ